MKAAIYTRFSSDNQTELSTQAQVRACTEYAKANGLDIYKIYSDEAISGTEEKTDHRLQYQLMLQDAKQKRFDVLLIHKYDRVARSLEEHVRLSKMMEREKIPKEQEYDTLMKNMSVMVLAPDILSDIHEKMKTIKEEIKVLENTTPPEEYSTDVILDWLKSIRTAPDSRAVHLLVQRIEVTSDNEKTDFNVVSTLESVSEKLV